MRNAKVKYSPETATGGSRERVRMGTEGDRKRGEEGDSRRERKGEEGR